jgi:hypothetical protein
VSGVTRHARQLQTQSGNRSQRRGTLQRWHPRWHATACILTASASMPAAQTQRGEGGQARMCPPPPPQRPGLQRRKNEGETKQGAGDNGQHTQRQTVLSSCQCVHGAQLTHSPGLLYQQAGQCSPANAYVSPSCCWWLRRRIDQQSPPRPRNVAASTVLRYNQCRRCWHRAKAPGLPDTPHQMRLRSKWSAPNTTQVLPAVCTWHSLMQQRARWQAVRATRHSSHDHRAGQAHLALTGDRRGFSTPNSQA